MSNKDTFEGMHGITVSKNINEVRVAIGGSIRHGLGGRWSTDGMHYLALNGHLSRGGMPVKLECTDGDIPASQTDVNKLEILGIIAGKTAVEFE